MRRVVSFAIVLLVLPLAACGGSLWPTAGSNEPWNPDKFIANAVQQHVTQTEGNLQAFTVYDIRQINLPDHTGTIVFFIFTKATHEHEAPAEGFGYAVGDLLGAQRFNILHERSVSSQTPPTLVGYDTDQYSNNLIMFGRVFSPDVHVLRLHFADNQPLLAAPTPRRGIAVINSSQRLLNVDVLGANEHVLAQYQQPRLLDQ